MAATLRGVIAIAVLLAACGGAVAGEPATREVDGCALTNPNGFTPPEPFPPLPSANGFAWHGTAGLWTQLEAGGAVWGGLPWHVHDGETEGHFGQKTFWWRDNYNHQEEPMPALRIVARRLDAKAAEVVVEGHGTHAITPSDGTAMLTGLELPSAGCWEITGTYQGTSLSYVVLVR